MLSRGEVTAPEGVSLTIILAVKVSLHVVMKEVVEVCVGPLGSYVPIGLTPGIFSVKMSVAGATQD